MIKKLRSIIGGNPKEVIYLKIKKILDKNFGEINLNTDLITKNKMYNTPIIINNFNRLTYLKEQINWLEKCGMRNIIIIDNQSTFIPLIEFYDSLNYKIIRCQKNNGYLSLWFNNIFNKVKNDFYIYTDSDVVGSSSCPNDFIEFFYENLLVINNLDKIGFGLKLENISNEKNSIYNIKKNENKFWINKYYNSNIFKASIDTTFALYKPNVYGGYWLNSGRTDYPYLADHLPWLDDKKTEESLFYEQNIVSKNSFYQSKRNLKY